MDPGCGLLLVIEVAVLCFFVLCCVVSVGHAVCLILQSPAMPATPLAWCMILLLGSSCGLHHVAWAWTIAPACMCLLAVLRSRFVWLGPQVLTGLQWLSVDPDAAWLPDVRQLAAWHRLLTNALAVSPCGSSAQHRSRWLVAEWHHSRHCCYGCLGLLCGCCVLTAAALVWMLRHDFCSTSIHGYVLVCWFFPQQQHAVAA
jgi:hypothetical protein